MKWFRPKKEISVDTAELKRIAAESIARTDAQQPHVTALTGWLNWRTDTNGFGEDIEYTLKPKGA